MTGSEIIDPNSLQALVCRMEEGRVEDVVEIKNETIILFRCFDKRIHPEDLPVEQLTQCKPIRFFGGGNILSQEKNNPGVGDVGVIIFSRANDFSRAYYIGQLEPSNQPIVIDQATAVADEGGTALSTKSGSGFVLSNQKQRASLFTANSRLNLHERGVSLGDNNISDLEMSHDAISLTLKKESTVNYGSLQMGRDRLNLRALGSMMIAADTGTMNIYAGRLVAETRGSIEWKGKDIKITAASPDVGEISLSSGGFRQNVTGNLLSSTAYETKVIKGDYNILVANGDVLLQQSSILGSITLKQGGGLLSPAAKSLIEMDSLSLEISQTSAFVLNSKITFDSGVMSISSFIKTNIKSKMINVEGLVVDFTKSSVMKSGPKVAVPTGTGIWCAMPFEPLTGLPMTGEVAMG